MPTPSEHLKALNKNLAKLAGIKKSAFNQSEQDIQTQLAGPLRAMITERLRQKKGGIAKNFHASYVQDPSDPIPAIREAKTANDYIKYMSRDKSWAGITEAQVLGEALGVTIQVQPYDKQGQAIAPPYTAFDAGKNAPTMHLDNHAGVHWTARGKQTIGDGNCLFNASAQALQNIIQSAPQKKASQKNIFQRAISASQKLFSKKSSEIPAEFHTKLQSRLDKNAALHGFAVQKPEEDHKTTPLSNTRSDPSEPFDWENLEEDDNLNLTTEAPPPSYESLYNDNNTEQQIAESLEVQENLREQIKTVSNADKPFYESMLKKEEDKLSALLNSDKKTEVTQKQAQTPPKIQEKNQSSSQPPSPEKIARIQQSLMGKTKTPAQEKKQSPSPEKIAQIQRSLMGKTKTPPPESPKMNAAEDSLKDALEDLKQATPSSKQAQENKNKLDNTEEQKPTSSM